MAKSYVQNSSVTDLDFKQSVRAATTANITLSGTQTVDGISLSVGNRVLVKNQTTDAQNGIYIVQSSSWTRSVDAAGNSEITSGLFVFVEEGSVNADTFWHLTTNNPITVDTTSLVFSPLQSGGGGGISDGNKGDITVSNSGSTFTINPDTVTVEDLTSPARSAIYMFLWSNFR